MLLLPLLLLAMAFHQAPLVDPAPISVPTALTDVQVGKTVKAALTGRGWTVAGQQGGTASLSRHECMAKICAGYAAKVRIRYVGGRTSSMRPSATAPDRSTPAT